MSPRRAARTDNNQAEIITALRGVGASVLDLHGIGVAGVPDILVVFGERAVLMEIKNPQGKNRVKESQVKFRQTWRGRVEIVRSVDEALAAIGATVMGTAEVDRCLG